MRTQRLASPFCRLTCHLSASSHGHQPWQDQDSQEVLLASLLVSGPGIGHLEKSAAQRCCLKWQVDTIPIGCSVRQEEGPEPLWG